MSAFRRRYLPALAALWLLVAVLAATAITRDFWEDESWTVNTAQQPLDVILRTDLQVHPPLHYLLSAGWFQFAGRSELALRWFAIGCAALTLALGYRLAWRWFGRRGAIAFAFLLAVWPLYLTYAHQARYYSWATLLCMACLFFTDTFIRRRQARWLIGYAVCGIAALYTVYASVAVLAGCSLWVGMGLRGWPSRRRAIVLWLAANALIALAFVPWLSTFSFALQQNIAVPGAGGFLREAATRGALLAYAFMVGETISPLNPLAWLGAIVVLVILLVPMIQRRVCAQGWRLLALFAFIFAASVAIAAASRNNPSPQNITNRSLLFLPLFVMGVGYCLSRWRAPAAHVLSLALVAVITVALFNLFTLREFMRPLLTVPWNRIMQTVQASGDGRVLLCNEADYACFYYGQVYGLQPVMFTEWPQVSARNPAEVWWVNSNLSTRATGSTEAIFNALSAAYGPPATQHYAPQDPSIRAFKMRFAGSDAYEHRVDVWHFTR
jgi:uncharacterized membrane protein